MDLFDFDRLSYSTRRGSTAAGGAAGATITMGDILAATGSLTRITDLHQKRYIGSGVSFDVEEHEWRRPKPETPILVAVKYMRLNNPDNIEYGRRRACLNLYDIVLRELQALSHQPLKDHPNVIDALGYGWKKESGMLRPFVVVELATYGTLQDFCRALQPPSAASDWEVLRELSLDVAAGIQALHSCDIIHGDVKTANVLVFVHEKRGQVAKVADFGASLFDIPEGGAVFQYTGTPLYNAPEIEARGVGGGGGGSARIHFSKELLFKADVYSYGLLVWELFKNGKSYIEENWLEHQEQKLEFLERTFVSGIDGVLKLSEEFCESLAAAEQGIESTAAGLKATVMKVFRVTLKDEGLERAGIDEVVEILDWHKRCKNYGSPEPNVVEFDGGNYKSRLEALGRHAMGITIPREPKHNNQNDRSAKRVNPTTESNVSRSVSFSNASPPESSSSTNVVITGSSGRGLQSAPKLKKGPGFTAFKGHPSTPRDTAKEAIIFRAQSLEVSVTAAALTPWDVQLEITNELSKKVTEEGDDISLGKACLQLSMCYAIGFGVEVDHNEMLRLLHLASSTNSVAQAIFPRVSSAFSNTMYSETTARCLELDIEKELSSLTTTDSHDYYSTRVRHYQRTLAIREAQIPLKIGEREFSFQDLRPLRAFIRNHVNADTAKPMPLRVTVQYPNDRWAERMLLHHATVSGQFVVVVDLVILSVNKLGVGLKNSRNSNALALACEFGHFNIAMFLSPRCTIDIDNRGITPLHWLIMFNDEEADELARSLVFGIVNEDSASDPLSGNRWLLNTTAEYIEHAMLPEHCLKLYGTPLHWAVQVRHSGVVRSLLKVGADVNFRVNNLSALDLAVALHLPEIAEILLDNDAETIGGSDIHSALHMVGNIMDPYVRYVIHGPGYQKAVKDVIDIMLKRGRDSDIDIPDKNGDSPFFIAVGRPSQEIYILEELLARGAKADWRNTSGYTTVTQAASAALIHRDNSSTLAWLLQHDVDVNAETGGGFAALHLCAAVGSVKCVSALLQRGDIKINAQASTNSQTALHIAAQTGSIDVLEELLKAGADIHLADRLEMTPLESALVLKHQNTADCLIRSGANTTFQTDSSVLRNINTYTALHAGVANTNTEECLTRHLLSSYPELRTPEVINASNQQVGTALHKAAYFADQESVAALLEFGADPNARSLKGLTPLEMVEEILDKGLDKTYHNRVAIRGEYEIKMFMYTLEGIREMLLEATDCSLVVPRSTSCVNGRWLDRVQLAEGTSSGSSSGSRSDM